MILDELDIKITLMSGTANSFAITNFMSEDSALNLHTSFDVSSLSLLAKKFCELTNVDGFIILTESNNKNCDYKWIFLNRDGSPAEMCGNAARCVGHLTFKNHISGQEHTFESTAGEISVFVESKDKVTVGMTPIQNINKNLNYKHKDLNLSYTHLNTGVPHCVIQIDNMDSLNNYKDFAKALRNDTNLYPNGTNVTCYATNDNKNIESASFERGVEDFTKACGTGAVAAAFCHRQNNSENLINVTMPGGSVSVDFSNDTPKLIGPIEYNSTLFPEDIKNLWTN